MASESMWGRLRALDRREQVGLAVVGVLVVVAAVFWYTRSLPSPVQVVAAGGTSAPGTGQVAARPGPSPSTSPAVIVVDVAGLVRSPGVYQFHQGDRVIDAITRAGGARPGADLTSLNLAALLTDAEQIIVGKAGQGGVATGTSGASSGAGGGSGSPGALVNINTATLDQLETLPGIGPALGQRIIDYREQHGPFHTVNDLLDVSGIGDQRLADLRSMVTV